MKYTILLLFCLLLGCKNTDQKQASINNLETLVRTELGEPTSQDSNQDETFTIYRIEEGNNSTYPRVKYLITNNSTKTVVKKGFLKMGHIKWNGDYTIEILDIPGVMQEEKSMDDYRTIINLNQPNKK